jgi:hypothetical protein
MVDGVEPLLKCNARGRLQIMRNLSLIAGAALLAIVAAQPTRSLAAPLITAEEAELPPQKGAVANSARGITRGPKIEVPKQETAGRTSPMHFLIKFQALGGSSIDLEGLKVTYLKSPVVDLTPRIRPFAQPNGIDMPDAQLPPGEHLLRIDVKDSEGRTSSTSLLLKVVP